MLNSANRMSDGDRYARRLQTNKTRDVVSPERFDNPVSLDGFGVKDFLEFDSAANPGVPASGKYRLYANTSGSQTDLFIINSAGVSQELLSSAAITLDNAYSNGSVINVDISDLTMRLSSSLGLAITSDDGLTNYWSARATGVSVGVTETHTGTNTIRFRDADISIHSQDDGFLDLTADIGIRLNTPIVGVNVDPEATLHVLEAESTGTVFPGILFENAAHTELTASIERTIIRLDLSNPIEFDTGPLVLQRGVYVLAPEYSFVGASVLSNAATWSISGAPYAGTNATITNSHALYIEQATLSTDVTSAWGLSVNAPTGATNNYAAQFLSGLVRFGAGRYDSKTTATISSGAITATSSYMQLDTEGGAATDDLDTINGGEIGMEITIQGTDAARVITVKDSGGNFYLSGDCVLDSPRDTITLIKAASNEWHEKCRSNNA